MASKVIFMITLMVNFIECVSEKVCPDGFHGDGCNKMCPKNCIACIHENSCTKCKPRYYIGLKDHRRKTYTYICEGQCAPNCFTCSKHYTNCTACDDGYYIGKENDDPGKNKRTDCTNRCFPNCKTCVSYKNCSECDDGYFGQLCDKKCPAKCTKCDKLDGRCDEKCENGYLGPYCNLTCSTCKNNNCSIYGKCLTGCKDGNYGSLCQKTCPQHCQRNCDGEGKCYRCKIGYFGERCNKTCSNNCFDLSCKQNGECHECIQRYYGASCKTPCPNPCSAGICDKTTGICLESEQDDVSGDEVFTDERNGTKDSSHVNESRQADKGNQTEDDYLLEEGILKEEDRINFPYLLVVVIPVAGAVVIVVFAAILYVIIKRRRAAKLKKNQSDGQQSSENQTVTVTLVFENESKQHDRHLRHKRFDTTYDTSDGRSYMMSNVHEQGQKESAQKHTCDPGEAFGMIPCEFGNDRNTYYNTGAITRKTSVIDLPSFIQNKADILNDFQLLPVDLIKPYADSQRADNVHRNRYKIVYPYDFNRVKLNNVENDYINASYIDGYNRQNAYIAALGPTAKTTADFELFWHMIWQENVEKIVMLTNLVEAGGPKCEMYWPRNGCSEIYGDMKVTCLQEDIFADYTLRVLELSGKSSKRAVHHFHYTGWPDKGVPSELSSIIDLRQRVLHAPSVLGGPILIHCSAGVGRTGTYIALDILIEQGEHENGVDIYSCVRNLREQRVNMVQTLEQYQFLHNTVTYALFVDCKPIPEGQFEEFMDCSPKEDIGDTYEKMQKVNELKSKMEKEVVARNKMLTQQNREGADIPGDENRPRLYMNVNPGSSDYINAVYINGVTLRNRYIVAQTPLPTTVENFLTLMLQENCSVIVDLDSSQDKTCGRYLPEEDETLQIGSFNVSISALETEEYFSSCKVTLSHTSHMPVENRELQLYKYKDWNDDSGVPNSSAHFLKFVRDIEAKVVEDDKMLVHCRTGGERCGLLCAIAVILQKVEIDGEVSIPNVVKQIKSRRSLAIPNKGQFVFCYECAREHVRNLTHTYANFVKRTR